MADFLTNLWNGIFEAGPTPTLLVATNATFAALQLVLLALLIATYSIHFTILSILCAGLWYAINWFATELRAAQLKEQEAERLRKKGKQREWKSRGEVGDSADDEGEDTEVEGPGLRESVSYEPTKDEERVRDEILDAMRESGQATAGAGSGLERPRGVGESRQRTPQMGEVNRSGEISSSTDSEWEKVEDAR